MRRNSLPDRETREKSLLIKERLFGERDFNEAGVVLFYVNKGSEVQTQVMIEEALAAGKRVVVPVTLKEEGIQVCEIKSLDELVPGSFGVPEPDKKYRRFVSPEIIDLAIIPGVAFDLSGFRLGYGGGYFDRFLSRIKTSTIGLSFEVQIRESLPRERKDIPVDKIITERQVLVCKR